MPGYADLIAIIYRYGCYQSEGQKAIQALVEGGESAFDVFQSIRQDPPASEIHERDLAETFIAVIGRFAAKIPNVVLDRFEAGELEAFETYWALGIATDCRSIDVLISGLKHKDQFCRWAAAESLIQRKSNRATDALLDSLKDRSADVKFAVVSAMRKRRDLRRPDALPALRRIVSSKANMRHSPGMVKCAEEVVSLIQQENR